MSTPIIELIAANIASEIDDVTVANGDNFNLTALRPKTITYKDNELIDGLVVITQAKRENIGHQSQAITWRQQFMLTCWVINSENASVSYETKANQMAADIEKKLMVDRERVGNADNTRLLGAENFESEIGTGVIVTIEVDYKVLGDDPYTKS